MECKKYVSVTKYFKWSKHFLILNYIVRSHKRRTDMIDKLTMKQTGSLNKSGFRLFPTSMCRIRISNIFTHFLVTIPRRFRKKSNCIDQDSAMGWLQFLLEQVSSLKKLLKSNMLYNKQLNTKRWRAKEFWLPGSMDKQIFHGIEA